MRDDQTAPGMILDAREGGTRLVAETLAPFAGDAESAYAIQRAVAGIAATKALGPVVGYKIGISTTAGQLQHGIAEPVMGRVYQSRLIATGGRLTVASSRRIGVEVEIGVKLARDLAPEGGPVDVAQAARAIGACHPAIELLENRFSSLERASLWTMAADDMLGMGGVIGEPITGFDLLAAHDGSLAVDGAVRALGNSSELAGGGPLPGIAWLANRLAGQGLRLEAGAVVFSGGLNAPLWLEARPGMSTLAEARLDGEHIASVTIDWTN